MSSIPSVLRSYSGRGSLRFASGKIMDCQFKLILNTTGKLTLECITPFTTEFARIGSRQIDDNYVELTNASFTGKTDDGGAVDINEASLEITTLKDRGTILQDNLESKYIVDLDSLDVESINFLSRIMHMKGNPRLAAIRGKRILEGHMTFLIIREVTIHFNSVNQNDVVTVSWGLVNLQFVGCEQGIAGRPYPDSFKINIDIDKPTFTVYHVDDYQYKIEQLKVTAGVDITANAITATNILNCDKQNQLLKRYAFFLLLLL